MISRAICWIAEMYSRVAIGHDQESGNGSPMLLCHRACRDPLAQIDRSATGEK